MKKQKVILIVTSLCIVLFLTAVSVFFQASRTMKVSSDLENAYVEQKVVEVTNQVHENTSLYYEGKMIGVITEPENITKLLKKVYKEKYKDLFPDSSLSLGMDVHEEKFYSLQTYEDKDDEILAFIEENDLFSIQAKQVSFSNGSVLYIQDEETYQNAKDKYVLNYTNAAEKESEYGRVILASGFEQKESISTGYAPVSMVLQNEEEILSWFLNGYNDTKEIYIVEDGDTVQGAASKNALEVIEIMALNYSTIIKENQLLEAGLKLDVTGINSPVDYRVEKEATTKVTLYPESPKYVNDSSLPLGVQKVVQEEKLGYRKDTIKEIYVNGELSDYEILSCEELSVPQQMIIHVGTQRNSNYVDSGNLNSGTLRAGNFRYPCDYAVITCSWGCYYGHQAMDVANLYNRYGNVLASDSGTVTVNDYNYINGYYMLIDHGNGFVTYYGHMNTPGYAQVGEYVERGEVIGQIGQTGVATGPHIHFEIRYNGQKMDPALYLQ